MRWLVNQLSVDLIASRSSNSLETATEESEGTEWDVIVTLAASNRSGMFMPN